MVIEVTDNDIRNGRKLAACYCPIALAVTRQANRHVIVYTEQIELSDRFVNLPKEAIRFINDFDNDGPVEPFTFELAL